ncbi:spore germination protein GerPE [Bacillus alveayuensis]|uniref:spore germination protein GerPE n=1 Tax=Aeribacillus alveayuensis TaxID=279215 RepID=UPI0005CDA98D|nr:spore germination protein GerPE [Bacillus alveayuensis]
MKRLSVVQLVHNEITSFSAVLQIGDSKEITARTKVLAVQRQHELFFGSEGEVNFHIFTDPIRRFAIDTTSLQMNKLNESPVISVRTIRVLAIAFSSVVHIGSTSIIDTEARVKHTRQLASDSGAAPSLVAPQASIRITKDESSCRQ